MGITLRVTPEELKAAAAEITEAVKAVGQSFEKVDEKIRLCAAFWEGTAHRKHQEICGKMQEEAKEAIERIEGYPDKILRMAEIYTSAEQVSTDTANMLSSEIL